MESHLGSRLKRNWGKWWKGGGRKKSTGAGIHWGGSDHIPPIKRSRTSWAGFAKWKSWNGKYSALFHWDVYGANRILSIRSPQSGLKGSSVDLVRSQYYNQHMYIRLAHWLYTDAQYFCICAIDTWEYHFWYPWTILFFKNMPFVGSFQHSVIYCMCVWDTW